MSSKYFIDFFSKRERLRSAISRAPHRLLFSVIVVCLVTRQLFRYMQPTCSWCRAGECDNTCDFPMRDSIPSGIDDAVLPVWLPANGDVSSLSGGM